MVPVHQKKAQLTGDRYDNLAKKGCNSRMTGMVPVQPKKGYNLRVTGKLLMQKKRAQLTGDRYGSRATKKGTTHG